MPSCPSPDIAILVRRSWISILRRSAWTVAPRVLLTLASSSAVARSWACSRALARAIPACWAITRSRNCSARIGASSAETIRKPTPPARLRRAYAQPQDLPGTSTAPPRDPRPGSCRQTADRAGRKAQDLPLVAALGHQHGQDEQALEVGELGAQLEVLAVELRRGLRHHWRRARNSSGSM